MLTAASVLHVYRTDRAAVLRALDLVMKKSGFERSALASTLTDGVAGWVHDRDALREAVYLVSDRVGNWVTVIEGDFVEKSPETAEVAQRVSAALDTFALSLVVGDVMFYNFFQGGGELDSYISFPLYLENGRLSAEEIESVTHVPEEFLPVLPSDRSIRDVAALLDRGWWSAHASGTVREEGDGFALERERMTALGTLLGLHGGAGEYPYAAWREDSRIDWSGFQLVGYR